MAIQKCRNDKLWGYLVKDLDYHIELGAINNLQVYGLMRSLHAVGLLNSELSRSLVDYMVKKGYDSDDLMNMSTKKGGYRRAVQFICLVS